MQEHTRGFTMIELIVVIVLLGILSAIALPKFLDLRTDAHSAAIDGIASAIQESQNLNAVLYRATKGGKGTPTSGKTCFEMAGALLQTGVPDGFGVLNVASPIVLTDNSGSLPAGTYQVCRVRHLSTGMNRTIYIEVLP